MPQGSNAYAVGRVRGLERGLLSAVALRQRLMGAETPEEVARALSEMGWGECKTQKDVEIAAEAQVFCACELVKECTTDPDATDCFLYPYDYLNIKLLLKARILNIEPGELSRCGTIDLSLLEHAVQENNYKELPDFLAEDMRRIEDHIAHTPNPLYIDAEVDKSMFAIIEKRMSKCKEKVFCDYFSARADLTNILIAWRVANMGREAEVALQLFVAGGSFSQQQLSELAQDPLIAKALVRGKAYEGMASAAIAQGNAALLEKLADDYGLAIMRVHRYEPTSLIPLIGYLLAKQREAAALRLIVTAKAVRMPDDKLHERLRELYE